MILLLTFFGSGIFILSILILGFKWKRLKLFFHDDNYTYFDLAFISLYFIEQVIFITISYFYQEYNVLLTGLFALIVVTTVSAQKVMLESKSKKISDYSRSYIERAGMMREQYEKELDNLREYASDLINENKKLQKDINKNLEK